MDTFSVLLALCAGNSPVPGEFPAQRPATQSFDVFFDLRPNKRLSKQSWGWWFEMPLHPLWRHCNNKANLRDLIAATGLVILLKLDLNRRFFSPCDLEIWWMTPKNNRAPLLCYYKLFASFLSHWWIQTGITVRKRLIWVNIDAFLSRVTLKFDGWPSKTIGHLFYATSSFMHHFVAIGKFKLELESGNAQSGSNLTLFRALWPWNLTDDLQKQ